eukprot:scaffold17829_cov23-Prasinocladus_malaysianus.AAC.1
MSRVSYIPQCSVNSSTPFCTHLRFVVCKGQFTTCLWGDRRRLHDTLWQHSYLMAYHDLDVSMIYDGLNMLRTRRITYVGEISFDRSQLCSGMGTLAHRLW